MTVRTNIGLLVATVLAVQPVMASAQSASSQSISSQSISERGPGKFQSGTAAPTTAGAGAELRLTIPLGARAASGQPARSRLDLNAGPMIAQTGTASQTIVGRAQGGLVNLRLTPGHSAKFSIAGQSVVTHYGPLAADEEREGDEKDGGGPSTLGWIGIGLGTVIVVSVVGTAIALADFCSECDQ